MHTQPDRALDGRGAKSLAMRPEHQREPHGHDDTSEHETEILELLRGEGGRVTIGRRAIVRALLNGPDHHVTADDVARMVQAEHPDVHLSTVYRTLDTLEHHGVVDRVNLGPGGAVYHLSDHAHHHLVCEVCGTVIEIPGSLFTRLARTVDERYGFELSDRHIAVNGRCPRCRDA
jgi:Fur family ferric uptake transcriptional regulator